MLRRPAFVFPARAGLEQNQLRIANGGLRMASKRSGTFAFDFGRNFRAFGQPLKIVMDGHAERWQDRKIPIHGMGVE